MIGKLWYLKKFDIFSDLSSEDVKVLAEQTKMKNYDSGRTIYFPGQSADSIYILKEGQVRLSRTNADGRTLTIALLEPGELFGEMTLKEDGEQSVRAEALKDSLICWISREKFLDFLSDHPELNLKVTQFMEERRRNVEAKVENLIYKDASGRLAYVLKDLVEDSSTESRRNRVKNKTGLIQLSHQELADLAGLTRPTTTKLLNEYADEGVLDLHRKKIVVRDCSKIQSLLDSSL